MFILFHIFLALIALALFVVYWAIDKELDLTEDERAAGYILAVVCPYLLIPFICAVDHAAIWADIKWLWNLVDTDIT